MGTLTPNTHGDKPCFFTLDWGGICEFTISLRKLNEKFEFNGDKIDIIQ